MNKKLFGIFPYIYIDKPIKFGNFRFTPILVNQLDKKLRSLEDRRHLRNILNSFKDGFGQPILAATYFIVSPDTVNLSKLLNDLQKAITLLRFSLFNSEYNNFSFEQTFFYLFGVPPVYETEVSKGEFSFRYNGLVNFQDNIYIQNNLPIFPPITGLKAAIAHESDFDNLEQILSYYGEPLGLTEHERERFETSIEWYNQTFQKHPIRDDRGKIVDIATAFEVLLDLPQENVSSSFRACIEALLGSSPELRKWATSFYDARSQIVHRGKAKTLLFRHPEAVTEHISLLASSRKIFTWCIYTMLGDIRGFYQDDIVSLFISNEVYLSRLRKAGNFENIKKLGLLEDIVNLSTYHPGGQRKDILWLGKVLLKAYKSHYPKQADTFKTLDLILSTKDDDLNLSELYNVFRKEFEYLYLKYVIIPPGESLQAGDLGIIKPILKDEKKEQRNLEIAIYSFSDFASIALIPSRK